MKADRASAFFVREVVQHGHNNFAKEGAPVLLMQSRLLMLIRRTGILMILGASVLLSLPQLG